MVLIFIGNAGCLTGFPTLSEVTSLSCPSSCSFEGLNNEVQLRLFPDMNISCSGMLQGLTVAGVFGSRLDRAYPEFQIWRPITTGSATQYNKISTFTDFQNSCSGSQNVQDCVVHSISVSTGDILGILLPRDSMSQASFRIYFQSSTTTNPTPNYILSDSAVTMYTLESTNIDGSNRPLVYLNIVEGG